VTNPHICGQMLIMNRTVLETVESGTKIVFPNFSERDKHDIYTKP
jgi:hypothetical protein